MKVARLRFDGVFEGFEDINSVNGKLPRGYSYSLPPDIPNGHYAVLNGTWQIVEGSPPRDPREEQLELDKISNVRAERNKHLLAADIQVIRALENGIEISQAWKDYRQALRDIPSQPGFPNNIVWPQKPE